GPSRSTSAPRSWAWPAPPSASRSRAAATAPASGWPRGGPPSPRAEQAVDRPEAAGGEQRERDRRRPRHPPRPPGRSPPGDGHRGLRRGQGVEGGRGRVVAPLPHRPLPGPGGLARSARLGHVHEHPEVGGAADQRHGEEGRGDQHPDGEGAGPARPRRRALIRGRRHGREGGGHRAPADDSQGVPPMEPLITLIAVTALLLAAGALGVRALRPWPVAVRGGLAAMFVLTGGAHFIGMREELIAMVPPALPAPGLLVTVTGVLELAGAAALLWRRTAPWSAAGLSVLLVAMFPANVH